MAVATVPRETLRPGLPAIELVALEAIDVVDNVREVGDVSELAESIRTHGVLQPIQLRRHGARYTVDFGHRRLAASKAAGMVRIPAIIAGDELQPFTDRKVVQLVENLQRQDLNPLEEAKAFRAILAHDPSLTQAELARQVGRSAPYVSNALRILELDAKVLPLVESEQLSGSHAKALASLKGKPQREYAAWAVEQGWSAHETERRIELFHAQAKREAEEVAKLGKWAAAAEDQLIAAGAESATSKVTTLDGYGYSGQSELAALKARGWTVQTESYSRGKCDCTAFGIGRTWDGKTKVIRRCIVRAHYQAKNLAEGRTRTTSWEEQNRVRKAYEARQQLVKKGIRSQVAAGVRKLPPDVARVLLWVAMDWSLNEWVKDHKGDRKKPDAWGSLSDLQGTALVDALTDFALKAFADRYNVKLDWPAIAEAFGVKLPAEKPAKKTKAKS